MTGAAFEGSAGRLFADFTFALLALLIAAAMLMIARARDKSTDLLSPAVAGGTQSIVALRDGRTLVVPQGTVGRDLVDWLASRRPGERYFELGGHQFLGDTSEPTPESEARIDRFAAMLKAYPDVSVRIIGYSDDSGNPAEDLGRSQARARRLAERIGARGIAVRRVAVEGRGAATPIASNATFAGRSRNRRVAIVLARRGD